MTTMCADAVHRPRLRALGLVLLVGSLAWHGYDISRPGLLDRSGRLKAPDFVQFYTYGVLAAEGHVARLYRAEAHVDTARARVSAGFVLRGFAPNYGPGLAVAMAPLAALPLQPALLAFSALSALLYAVGVALLARHARSVAADPIAIALLAAAWPAFVVVLRYGQISTLSLFVFAVAIHLVSGGRRFAAGLVLGLLVFKPPLLVVPGLVFVLCRERALVGGMMTGAAAETLFGLWLVGPGAFQEYLAILVRLAANPDLVQFFPAESHSLRGFTRLIWPQPLLLAGVALTGLIAATWAASGVWRRHADQRLRWSVLVTAMIVSSPHALTYDLALLAIPLLLAADWCLDTWGTIPPGAWRWSLGLMAVGAWPGTLLARLYHVQLSTIGMALLLCVIMVEAKVLGPADESLAAASPDAVPPASPPRLTTRS
jgi:alpha-1,2-mannosyltransferase